MAAMYGSTRMETSGNLDVNSHRRFSDLTISKELEHEDTLSEKLLREAQVFIGGSALGLAKTTGDRLQNHFPETAIQTAGFAGLSYGIVRFASANTPFRYVVPVISTAMTYSFLANTIRTLPEQLNTMGGAWQETWNSRSESNVREQSQKIANTLGPFLFDASLGMASGLIGGKIAANQVENRAILGFMKDKYQTQLDHSVYRIASEPDATGMRFIGSSFAIEPQKLATAFHVIQDKPGTNWTFLNKTERGNASIVAGFPQSDLAILAVKDGPAMTPLPVAKTFSNGEPGILMGVPGKKFVMSPAHFSEGIGVTMNSFTADLGPEVAGGLTRTIKGGKAWPGMSGGPAISTNGEVVGVMTSSNPVLNIFGAGTNSVPARNLNYFMEMIERSQTRGSLSLSEASQQLGFSGAKVLDQIRKGKLDAFVIPSTTNVESWEWRILKK